MTFKNTLWLLFLLPMLALGQDNSPKGRIRLGVDGSLDYNYRTLRLIRPDAQYAVDEYDALELPQWGFTTGLSFHWQMGKRLGLGSGLYFADRGSRTRIQEIYTPWPDPAFPENPVDVRTVSHDYFFEVPLYVTYTFIHAPVEVYGLVGGAFNHYLGDRTDFIFYLNNGDQAYDRGGFNRHYGRRWVGASAWIGAGLGVPLTNRMGLKVEPCFRYMLWNSVANSFFMRHLYSGGLNVGVNYTIR